MTADDPELLSSALAGDERCFTTLYRRRQPGVYRFALHMTGSVAMAEDATQETFLALLTHGSRYNAARGTVASFLFGIARNLVLQRLDRQPQPEAEGVDFASSEDVLGDLTRQETIDRVRRAVLSLPPAYREVVVLCDLEDASYEEAAAALECPVGTVRSRLSRARSILAQKLEGVAVSAGRSIS
jgi:RNA polymerase sigma-70 factor (ECF subfamily)